VTRRGALLTLLALVGAATLLVGPRLWQTVAVAPGEDVGAVAREHPGRALVLAPGEHSGFTLDTRVTVTGAEGAVVSGPIVITADRTRLRDLSVIGGPQGIFVRDADDVVLERVEVVGASLHGIEVHGGSVTVRDCQVRGMQSHWGRAIVVRNATDRGSSRIQGCTVEGAQDGIAAHAARIEVVGNEVTGTTTRAIAIMEMSEARVMRNRVNDVAGAGLYCGDVSFCEFRDNEVSRVVPDGTGFRSHSGHAAVAWYYSAMHLDGNVFDVDSEEPVGVYHGSRLVDRPLIFFAWPRGWRGALPAIPVALVSLGVLLALRWLTPVVGRAVGLQHRVSPDRPGPRAAQPAVAVGIGLFAVQTFHMVEHIVQVWQVHVAAAESRAGFVGHHVDTEPLHFAYNAAVLALLVLIAWHVRGTAGRFAPFGRGFSWLGATIVLQGYHVAEHVAKLSQHLRTGLDPAPGLIGANLGGLVWFHFGINLAVYVGTVIVVVEILRARRILAPDPPPTGPTADGRHDRPLVGQGRSLLE
jgi:hypothetical protein